MAPTPFRRRKAATTVRNLAIAEAALALAKDRVAATSGRRSRRPSGKLLVLGGAVAAAGAFALLNRDKVAGLLPSRSAEPAPTPPAPPQPSNYDAPGPVANTATPVPAPDPQAPAAIDEQAEEAAAAAEPAAIGGSPSDYAGPEQGEPADEAFRPLAEAGEGEAEGQEQAEAELEANAAYRDQAPSDAERQIDDVIEQAGRPGTGETPEPLDLAGPASAEPRAPEPVQETFLPPAPSAPAEPTAPAAPAEPTAPPAAPEPAPDEPRGATDEVSPTTPGGGISGNPYAGLDTAAREQPAAPEPSEPEAARPEPTPPAPEPEAARPEPTQPAPAGDDADDWRTWSGRAVRP